MPAHDKSPGLATRRRGRGAATALARLAGAHVARLIRKRWAPASARRVIVWTGVPSLFLAAGFVPEHAPPRGRGLYLLTMV